MFLTPLVFVSTISGMDAKPEFVIVIGDPTNLHLPQI